MNLSALPSFDAVSHIHFVGIGGISMSALAKLCILEGFFVSGSDAAHGEWFSLLSGLGADVTVGSNPASAAAADLVVHTAAVAENDADLQAAKAANVPIVRREAFLHLLESLFNKSAAIAGTHGKTTVTALTAHVLREAKASFTAHIGGKMIDGDNLLFCGKDLFITEACEYKRSFLTLTPDIGVILNLECDHPDCYSSEKELVSAFNAFSSNIKDGGYLIVNGDTTYQKLDIPKHVHALTFGFAHTNICRPVNMTNKNAKFSFDVMYEDMHIGHVDSPLYGRHNVSNVLSCISILKTLKVADVDIFRYIHTFKGIERRFETVRELNGAKIIFDYAHHPSEISAVIETAKGLLSSTNGTLRVYFQPHTYSRTASYFQPFIDALMAAPFLGLVKTYPARELPSDGLSALDLFEALARKRQVYYFDELLGASKHILNHAKEGDVALVLGAGDIYEIKKLL